MVSLLTEHDYREHNVVICVFPQVSFPTTCWAAGRRVGNATTRKQQSPGKPWKGFCVSAQASAGFHSHHPMGKWLEGISDSAPCALKRVWEIISNMLVHIIKSLLFYCSSVWRDRKVLAACKLHPRLHITGHKVHPGSSLVFIQRKITNSGRLNLCYFRPLLFHVQNEMKTKQWNCNRHKEENLWNVPQTWKLEPLPNYEAERNLDEIVTRFDIPVVAAPPGAGRRCHTSTRNRSLFL